MINQSRIERWLTKDMAEHISKQSIGVKCPVPVANVDGSLFTYDGEFFGTIRGGGFTSLADLINEATIGGKRQDLAFVKAGATGVVGRSNSLWNVGSVPAAGGVGGTAGTGVAKTRTSTGALQQANAAGGDTLHIVSTIAQASVATNLLLLYDRLWDMTHTMTVDPQAVNASNLPTRYQTASTAPGNFISGEVTTVLPAATPTITFTYVDQDGNTAEAGPALSTIASAAAVNTVPFTAPNWKYPINNADTGVRSITNVDLSAAMASGVCTWFIGHPLMWIPQPLANSAVIVDGMGSAFNLNRIYDDACLAFLEIAKGATTATNYWGSVGLVSG